MAMAAAGMQTAAAAIGTGCEATVLRQCPNLPRLQRLQASPLSAFAVASSSSVSLYSVKVSRGRGRDSVWFCGSTRGREKRAGIRAVAELAEATTTAGLRETDERPALVDVHSRSFEGIRTEQGENNNLLHCFPGGVGTSLCVGWRSRKRRGVMVTATREMVSNVLLY